MAVFESLKAIVDDHPQARLVAFADLSSSMVLGSVGGEDLTQEHFNALCREAKAGFGDPMASLAEQAFGTAFGAIMIDGSEVRVFLRSQVESDDVMCCICDHGIDLTAFVARISATLEEFSAIS